MRLVVAILFKDLTVQTAEMKQVGHKTNLGLSD